MNFLIASDGAHLSNVTVAKTSIIVGGAKMKTKEDYFPGRDMEKDFSTCAESYFCEELLFHLGLFTSTTGGNPYVSCASTLLRNRIAALKTAVCQPPAPSSDYAAALRVLREYYGNADLRALGGFAEYCMRFNT